MYCRKCGIELREHAAFCDNCGAPLKNADTQVYSYDPYQRADQYHEAYPYRPITVVKQYKKSPFLLIMGIFALIIASVGLYINIMEIALATAIDTFTVVTTFLSLLSNVAALASGISAIRFWRTPERMRDCISWGSTWIICLAVSKIVDLMLLGELSGDAYLYLLYLTVIFSLIPSILYVIAASAFKKAR